MTTVHLVFNAHLDPIWLWPWSAGVDEALATCRSACDRLDAHSDLVFTQGEAWVYEQIENIDPPLFQRIERHVADGRWDVVGGWYVQPDCNLPSGFALRHQIELGRRYFTERFGFFPTIGYNIDTFGHAAIIPTLLHEAGQDAYVMMRPQEHEMRLPARLFRWREREASPDIVTFRIARAYGFGAGADLNLDHVRGSLTELPSDIEHTMCFVGICDHGGGPTEQSIAWCREHAAAIDGAQLIFSSPSRFFAAIAPQRESLPLVTGELQHHAVGCYSVDRAVKTNVRRAEHRLAQAEIALDQDPRPGPDAATDLDRAWRAVCFHHFHDTLGGTCIPSAHAAVLDELGMAAAIADQITHLSLRRQLAARPDAACQRLVLYNPSDSRFAGYTEFEPWTESRPWCADWRLLDESGTSLPFQTLESEALVGSSGTLPGIGVCGHVNRLLVYLELEPAACRTLRIQTEAGPAPATVDAEMQATATGLHGGAAGPVLQLQGHDGGRIVFPHGPQLDPPQLELITDRTDTWSHDIDRYPRDPVETAVWDAVVPLDSGPLMAALARTGRIGGSRLRQEWRLYAGAPFLELRLDVHWAEEHKILKLSLTLPESGSPSRRDGIPGGSLERRNDGRERPVRDWTLLSLADGRQMAVVAPAVYALDADTRRLRLTLLRSPLMAWHVPHAEHAVRGTVADQGAHAFLLRFSAGPQIDAEILDRDALMLQRPLVLAQTTRGMQPDAAGTAGRNASGNSIAP